MGFGGNLLRTGRVIYKDWRPHCWLNVDCDKSKPCGVLMYGNMDNWTCKTCPFRPKEIDTNKTISTG